MSAGDKMESSLKEDGTPHTPFDDRSMSYTLGFTDGLMWMAAQDPLQRGLGTDGFAQELVLRVAALYEEYDADPQRWHQAAADHEIFEKLLAIMEPEEMPPVDPEASVH